MPASLQIGLLVLGGVFLLIAVLAGPFKIFGAEIPGTVDNPYLRWFSGIFGIVLLMVVVIPLVISAIPQSSGNNGPKSNTNAGKPPSVPTFQPPSPPNQASSPVSIANCSLTISYPFVTLMSEPSHTSQQLLTVPPGSYVAKAYQDTSFAGQQERWFQIMAQGRTGWIWNNANFFSNKTAGCP